MITELGIRNFKAFGERQRVPIKPITLIFGANSSGKSSILHALLLAHHGMESGDYEARLTTLAGDAIDLGGFRSYVHQHNSCSTVTIQIETDVNHQELREYLDGNAEEKAAFLQLSHFGLSLTLADCIAPSASGENELAKQLVGNSRVARIAVLYDGQEVLSFSPRYPGVPAFWAHPSRGSERFLDPIIRSYASLGRARRPLLDDAEISAGSAPPKDEQTAGPFELKESAVQRPKIPTASGASLESDVAGLRKAFLEAMDTRAFHFEKLVLRDDGYLGATTRPSAKWSVEQGGEGLLDFYRSATVWEDQVPWCAEAQALAHNLAGVLEFCTKGIATELRGMSYLGPLRSVPPRDFAAQSVQDPRSVACGGSAWEILFREAAVVESVNRWLGPERLKTPYRLHRRLLLDADRVRKALEEGANSVKRLEATADRTELLFKDVQSETVLSHRDLGFGVGQVIPVLASAAALRARLVAIEQPELHLHPAQQAELGDVFIESALGERKNTFLLETHSEHLMLRLMRRMRETREGRLPKGATLVTPKAVAVLYVERDGDHSIVREMPLNERGELVKAWPGGFFEEGYRDLFS